MKSLLRNFCWVSFLNGSSAFQFQALQSLSTGVQRNASTAPTTTTNTRSYSSSKPALNKVQGVRWRGIFPSALASSATNILDSENNDSASPAVKKKNGFGAIFKYAFALSVQMGLFFGFFSALDNFIMPKLLGAGTSLPMICNILLFHMIALKSQIFNPLSNHRPKPSTKEITNAPARKMPTWTISKSIFSNAWLLVTISLSALSAVSSSMIVKASGGVYANKAILSLILHLSIVDTWHSINNVERRFWASLLTVFCVYTSAAFTAWQYYLVSPRAGRLLLSKSIWLIATSTRCVKILFAIVLSLDHKF